MAMAQAIITRLFLSIAWVPGDAGEAENRDFEPVGPLRPMAMDPKIRVP
jgi:hypothetical protein